MKDEKGFSLAELLIVVSIIAMLVAISIPIFSLQLEKSRRAVDMANARNIVSVLKVGMNTGDIEFEKDTVDDNPTCVVVVVNEDGMQAFASGSIRIDGKTYADGSDHTRITNYLTQNGIKYYTLKATTPRSDGWSFYSVFLYSDGTTKIGSGLQDDSNDYRDDTFETHGKYWKIHTSDIEKAMGLSNNS